MYVTHYVGHEEEFVGWQVKPRKSPGLQKRKSKRQDAGKRLRLSREGLRRVLGRQSPWRLCRPSGVEVRLLWAEHWWGHRRA